MDDIGFNDNLNVLDRTFHFQTASNSKKGEVRCEIFENGQVLSSEAVDFERRKTDKFFSFEKRLERIVEALHQEMMSEIELLFLISDKVKKLKHSPSNVKMGLMFIQNNLVDDAIDQFEEGIKNDPNYIPAYLHLGKTYLATNDSKKALSIFTQGVTKEKNYADLNCYYGLAAIYEKQYSKSLRAFQQSLKINPEYVEANYNLSLLYFESSIEDPENNNFPPPSIRIQRGVDHLDKIFKKGYHEFDQLYPKLKKFAENKKYDLLVKSLHENRTRIFKGDTDSLWGTSFFLKFMYGGKGLDNEIIRKYEHKLESTLKINNQYADVWNSLGIIHLIKCRNLFLQALSEFKRSLEINPNYDKAKKNKKLVENDGKEFLILLKAILK